MSYVHDRSIRHFPTVVAAREGSTCDITRLQSGVRRTAALPNVESVRIHAGLLRSVNLIPPCRFALFWSRDQ